MHDEPHVRRETAADPGWGRLRHGNRGGDLTKVALCGARTRAASACRQPAMANGRCRLYGGKSTGPRTASGLARSRAARLRHGGRTAEMSALRREVRAAIAGLDAGIARARAAIAELRGRRSTPCAARIAAPRGSGLGPTRRSRPPMTAGRTPALRTVPPPARESGGRARRGPHPQTTARGYAGPISRAPPELTLPPPAGSAARRCRPPPWCRW